HFNPDGKKHGLENPDGHHAGDMTNFTVNGKGKASVAILNKDVNLGNDSHSLFSNGGTGLVIHAKADDMKTDPAGNAGDRIACGVITKQERDTNTTEPRRGRIIDLPYERAKSHSFNSYEGSK